MVGRLDFRSSAAANEFQLSRGFGCRTKTVGRLPRQQLFHQIDERGGQLRTQARERRNLACQNAPHDRQAVVAVDRRTASPHRVQDAPESIQVDAAIDRLTLQLLRGHVRQGANQHAGLGQSRIGTRPSEPEIGKLHLAAIRHHQDVRGFHIAVNQPAFMRRRQPHRDPHPDVSDRRHRQRTAGIQQLLQVATRQIFHDQVRPIAAILDRVDRHHVTAVHGRGRSRLGGKPLSSRLVLQPLRGQHFDGYQAIERHIARREHHAHAAPPDFAEQLITVELRAHARKVVRPGDREPYSGRRFVLANSRRHPIRWIRELLHQGGQGSGRLLDAGQPPCHLPGELLARRQPFEPLAARLAGFQMPRQ